MTKYHPTSGVGFPRRLIFTGSHLPPKPMNTVAVSSVVESVPTILCERYCGIGLVFSEESTMLLLSSLKWPPDPSGQAFPPGVSRTLFFFPNLGQRAGIEPALLNLFCAAR